MVSAALSLILNLVAEPFKAVFTPQAEPTVTLKDRNRNKDLQVRVTYPQEQGRYPVIVLSHGLGGSKDNLQPLVQPWVKSGYIVIQPTHADSGVLHQPGALNRPLRELQGNPLDRPADITLVLDRLAELESLVPALKGKIDRQNIAMAGHSYGAWTTMAIGGLELYGPAGRAFSLADPRPKCLFAVSPQGTGPAMTAASFAAVTRPTLSVSGDKDFSPFDDKQPETRKDLFKHQKPGGKYLLWIEGADHGFGGINGLARTPQNPQMVQLVAQAGLVFFDACLKPTPESKARLQNKAFATPNTPHFEWNSK